MNNIYLDLIKLYIESDMTLLQIGEYLKERKIEIEISSEDLFKRCGVVPISEDNSFLQEEAELMLDKMMVDTMPESVIYLSRYIKKVEYENNNKLKSIIDSKKVYAYQKIELLKAAVAKAAAYYRKKLNTMVACSANYLMDEYKTNPVAAADKYNLDRSLLYKLVDKNLTLKKAHDTTMATKLTLVKQYINSGLSLLEYCKKANFTTVQFAKMVTDLESEHNDIFNEFNQYVSRKKKERELYIAEKALMISNYITNQINYGGALIKFTLLDYFSIISDEPSEFATEVHKLDMRKEGSVIDDFFGIKKTAMTKVNGIFGTSAIPKVQISKDMALASNDVINGIAVRRDDVDYIFEILDDNGIPKYRNIYNTALSRHLNGVPIIPLVENDKVKRKNIKL